LVHMVQVMYHQNIVSEKQKIKYFKYKNDLKYKQMIYFEH